MTPTYICRILEIDPEACGPLIHAEVGQVGRYARVEAPDYRAISQKEKHVKT